MVVINGEHLRGSHIKASHPRPDGRPDKRPAEEPKKERTPSPDDQRDLNRIERGKGGKFRDEIERTE